ncbi:ComF family protein [Cellulomonas fimi]|uniref:ComF family protein n=1 Tax=Cellulomonas fimi TaxID=1708 RepID=UPI00234CEEC9|nr:ComF family protein [Cellulomonas fimi]MDC7121130.1 ComF family protein [Cellulomonas fimi]
MPTTASLPRPRLPRTTRRALARAARHGLRLARDLVALVLPVACAGCGTLDVAWCTTCRSRLGGLPWRCEERAGRLDALDGRPPVPVWTLGDNVGPVRDAIVAWKDGGRLDLSRALVGAVARAAQHVAPGVPRSRAGPLLVVAVPSTAAARRRRGRWLVDDLARGAVRGLRSAGVDARRAPVLRRRGGRDQAGLGARARARNLVGQVRVARAAGRALAGRDVLLVDDVLTTGASVAASSAAVRAAGGVVVACLTLASTPGPGVRPHVAVTGWRRSSGSWSAGRAAIGPTPDRGVSVGV